MHQTDVGLMLKFDYCSIAFFTSMKAANGQQNNAGNANVTGGWALCAKE
jgi:hypothetical protein